GALNGAGSVLTGGGAATLTVTGGGAFSGNITGANTALTVGGTSQTLTLSGNNSFGGLTTVSAGTLKLGSATALGANENGTTVSSGAVLDLNGQTVGAENLTLAGTGIGGAGALINSSASAASLSGNIFVGAYTVGGTGAIALNGASTGAGVR